MKKIVLLCLLAPALLVSSSAGQDAAIEVEGRISAVTMYTDRAAVTREIEAQVPAGLQQLRLGGLTAALDPDSIRLSGRSAVGARIIGFAISQDYLPQPRQEEIRALEKEILDLEKEIAALKGQLEVIAVKEIYLRRLAQGTGTEAGREVQSDPQTWPKLLAFLGTELTSALKEKLARQFSLAENERKVETLRRKLADMAAPKPQEGRALTITLEAPQAGKVNLQLVYQVRGVSWRPVYTMRARPAEKKLEITLLAEVIQRSGENWRHVNLTLSSAAPARGAAPPKLPPWYLDIRSTQPPDVPMEQVRMKTAGAPAREEALLGSAPAPVMEVESALLGEQGVHVTFNARTPFSAASDGTARRVPLDSRTVEAGFFHSAVPKLRPEAFLAARTAPRLPYPLLAGECQLFMDDEFVAKSRIPTLAAGEEFVLHFGVDRQVLVKHEQIGGRRVAPVFLGRNRKLEHSYRISLENLHKTEISLELSDQLPVSRDSRLEIKSVELNPRPDGREENGLLSWKMKLAPGEKKEISISFSVEFPKDLQVSGI